MGLIKEGSLFGSLVALVYIVVTTLVCLWKIRTETHG
jgi:hypothetical protein